MKREHLNLARKVQAASRGEDVDAIAEASRAFAVALEQGSDQPLKRTRVPHELDDLG